MRQSNTRSTGFAAVELLAAVLVIVALGLGGWLLYQNSQGTDPAPTPSAATTQPTQTDKTQQLKITEWGLVLQTEGLSGTPTYKYVTDNQYLKPSVFLSSSKLDSSKTCQSYYTDPTYPSFQYIERYSADQKVPLDEGLTPTSIADAEKKMPTEFKVIDGYGYWFRHGNGMPCTDGGQAVLDMYKESFTGLKATP